MAQNSHQDLGATRRRELNIEAITDPSAWQSISYGDAPMVHV
jgi:hypothetical protein